MSEKELVVFDCAAPIEFETLQKVFEAEANGENIMLSVSYSESKIKGKELLYFLCNLDAPSDIDFEKDEDIMTCLVEYMSIDRVVDIPILTKLTGMCLAYNAGLDVDLFFTGDPYMNRLKGITEKFVLKEKELVEKWQTFFRSLPLFMIESNTEYRKVLNINQSYQTIDNLKHIGYNVVNLVRMVGFVDYILSIKESDDAEMFYFKEQFMEPIYKGKNLFYYMIESESVVFAACMSLLGGETTTEDMNIATKAAIEVEKHANDLFKTNTEV